jgi:hypothetical protein
VAAVVLPLVALPLALPQKRPRKKRRKKVTSTR